MTYLEEGAAEARKAVAANDKRAALAIELATYNLSDAQDVERETADRSLEIASVFTALAAIERGLPPGCSCRHIQAEETP